MIFFRLYRFNEVRLGPNEIVSDFMFSGNTLTINSAEYRDDSQYCCEARNEAGSRVECITVMLMSKCFYWAIGQHIYIYIYIYIACNDNNYGVLVIQGLRYTICMIMQLLHVFGGCL